MTQMILRPRAKAALEEFREPHKAKFLSEELKEKAKGTKKYRVSNLGSNIRNLFGGKKG